MKHRAAWRLHELGCDSYLVVDRAERPGGLATSVVDRHGFTWDVGGHVQFSHYGYYDALCDRALGDGSYFEAWFFEGRAGQRITVTMRSGAFDTFLAVGRHNGDVIDTNDDYESGNSTNSQVSISLPADGIYMIRANSLEASKTGDYTISLEEGAGSGNSFSQ